MIDKEGQNHSTRRDTWIAKQPLDLGWKVGNGEIRASEIFDLGYGSKNIPVTHSREIVFVNERFWVVFDMVGGKGEHLIESRFQFAPGKLVLAGTNVHTDFPDSNLLLVAAPFKPFTDIHVEEGQENPRGGWYSDSYGKMEPAPALSSSVKTVLPWSSATLLFPYRGTKVPEVSFSFDGHAARIQSPETGNVTVTCSLKYDAGK